MSPRIYQHSVGIPELIELVMVKVERVGYFDNGYRIEWYRETRGYSLSSIHLLSIDTFSHSDQPGFVTSDLFLARYCIVRASSVRISTPGWEGNYYSCLTSSIWSCGWYRYISWNNVTYFIPMDIWNHKYEAGLNWHLYVCADNFYIIQEKSIRSPWYIYFLVWIISCRIRKRKIVGLDVPLAQQQAQRIWHTTRILLIDHTHTLTLIWNYKLRSFG